MIRFLFVVVVALAPLGATPAGAQPDLAARIDAIVEAPIKAGTVAGASVAVVKGGTTLVSKATAWPISN